MRGTRWGFATAALVAVVIAGCSASGQEAGTATIASQAGTSASRTISTGSQTTVSRTASSSSSSSSSRSSESSSTSSTSEDPGPQWTADVQSYPVPAGLRAISPDGTGYAAWVGDTICLVHWDSTQVGCPVPAPVGGVTDMQLSYSSQGRYLGVVVTGGNGLSYVFIVDTTTAAATVLTNAGMVALDGSDPNARIAVAVSGIAWDHQERDFYVQQLAGQGATNADLLIASTDGVEPTRVAVPADIANSYPQMIALDTKVLFAPRQGAQAGTLWQLGGDLVTTQVGSASFNPGGGITLIALSPDGGNAMYCVGTGYDAGQLHEVDLDTAEDNPYLKEDEGCLGAAYSADGDYVAVIGPISQSLVLTVLAIDNDDVPLNEVLDGSVQRVPSLMTWNAADVMTVIEGDTSDKFSKISVLTVTR